MHNFGILFLWALAAWILFDGSFAKYPQLGYTILLDDISPNQTELRSLLSDVVQAQDQGSTRDADNEIKSKLETLEGKIGEVQPKLEGQLKGVEAKLEGKLQEVQTKLEAKLDESLIAVQKKIENQLQAVLNQLQAVSNKIDAAKVTVRASSTIKIPSGFQLIGDRYFRIVNEEANWETAEKRCRIMGGYLAAFRNQKELNAVKKKLVKYKQYWLGINDHGNKGHFVSAASLKPAPFLKWLASEPNIYFEDNCVYLQSDKMGDTICTYNDLYFICQADNET